MKPRILIAHTRYQQRGGEDLVMEMESELLRKNDHSIEIFEENNVSIVGMSRINLALRTIWSTEASRKLSLAINKFKPDLIHVHNTFPLMSPSIYWTASRQRIPVIQTLHNFRLLCPQAMLLRDGKTCEDCLGSIPWRGIIHSCYRNSRTQTALITGMTALHRIIKTYEKNISAYIALTHFSKSVFVKGGLPSDRIHIKQNFVDIPNVSCTHREDGLYVGRLSPEKGLACLAQAVEELPDLKIDIIGAGVMSEILSASPNFRLLGWKKPKDVYNAMRHAKYLVVPSIWYETFGLIIIEAFACGLPVIASRIGALAELVRDGETGLLVDPDSAKSLTQAITWAENNPKRLAAMGERARIEYETRYSPEINYDRLISIYEHVLTCHTNQVSSNLRHVRAKHND